MLPLSRHLGAVVLAAVITSATAQNANPGLCASTLGDGVPQKWLFRQKNKASQDPIKPRVFIHKTENRDHAGNLKTVMVIDPSGKEFEFLPTHLTKSVPTFLSYRPDDSVAYISKESTSEGERLGIIEGAIKSLFEDGTVEVALDKAETEFVNAAQLMRRRNENDMLGMFEVGSIVTRTHQLESPLGPVEFKFIGTVRVLFDNGTLLAEAEDGTIDFDSYTEFALHGTPRLD